MSQEISEGFSYIPDRSPPVGQPGGHHEPVVHEVAVDAVERSVLVQVHLHQRPVVEQVPGGNVGHVTAALHLLQEVVHLSTTLVILGSGAK